MENEPEEREEARKAMSRRKLLGLAAVTAAGLALTPLVKKAKATTDQPLIIGRLNEAGDQDKTELFGKVDETLVWEGLNAVLAVTNRGAAKEGKCPVQAVVGLSWEGRGIEGQTDNFEGVAGIARTTGIGVNGEAWENGTGVWGHSKEGIGVKAESPEGTALRVEGKSIFKTVGGGVIPKLKKSCSVVLSEAGLVTDKSHISVMLTSDPNVLGEDAAVSFVLRDPANNRFTINLTKAVGRDTTFTYFIVEP